MKFLFKIIFDIPFFYCLLRNMVTFGIKTKPIVLALDLKEKDRILDVGCGIGEYSKIVPKKGYYLGIDKDQNFIKKAKKNFKNKNIDFLCADFLEISTLKKSFNKAILVFLIHHLDDEDCEKLLKKLSCLVQDRCVIVENIYTKYHHLNNLLCVLDRGSFVRPLQEQKKLIEKYFEIEEVSYYYTRLPIKKRILFVCKPKHHENSFS